MLQHFNPRDQFKFLWAAIVLLCTFTTVMYSGKGVRTIPSENTVTTIDVVTTDTACAEHKHNALTDTKKYRQLVTQSTSARVCPCCGWEGALYGNFGLSHFDDRQCPRCQALERHRTMCAMAARRKDLFQPKTSKISRVLYFGGYRNSRSKAVCRFDCRRRYLYF
ncbi:hypothetical protein SARC_05954 [Sphaeroforma arctica JP610]|uniref:Uncharacterized protein n=1 Tax=Sphaeroforma arctica JP610 TaxID=667725 RepID=A0A0L0FY21_9EUKA|nr:hypothetical protein, variant [Sphaeroforma arctica JP610]XP_014155633.1 hypothetical protein SARC_05954 [Sphaeroforma arctica JP610]KNC81730.1 hypothetical protein, variant [Sphaeroforma arctica JP610]KNC81731.1 hypothetical protein SARC_05954 [Sphaeroforma arctica JP610]|eukprot:XP_014155632.1 hypothetical protein, variant [Sphaeroforma arctica JP610]